MEKGRFGHRLDVGVEGKGGVKDDTQVADFRRWGDGAAVNLKDEVTNLLEQRLGGHSHELCFPAV